MKGIRLNTLGVWASIVLVLLISSCGGDDPQNPNGNGDGEKTILSAASSNGWTVDLFIQEATGSDCRGGSRRVSDIGEVWVPGGFSVVTQSRTGADCCNYEQKRCLLDSKKVDLTSYKAARIQGTIRFYSERYIDNAGTRGSIKIQMHSNVPATPGFLVLQRTFGVDSPAPTLVEEDMDLSLENALAFKEASLSVEIEVKGWCGWYGAPSEPFRWNKMYLELRDFQIVGTR